MVNQLLLLHPGVPPAAVLAGEGVIIVTRDTLKAWETWERNGYVAQSGLRGPWKSAFVAKK